MYENGAANTSFEDARKAAKATGSQMSHYFADKRSLIRAVIAHQADAVMANHHDPAFGNLDSIAALARGRSGSSSSNARRISRAAAGSARSPPSWWSRTPSNKRTSRPALSAGKPGCVEAC
jgi:AcrR family transcriptional regulator